MAPRKKSLNTKPLWNARIKVKKGITMAKHNDFENPKLWREVSREDIKKLRLGSCLMVKVLEKYKKARVYVQAGIESKEKPFVVAYTEGGKEKIAMFSFKGTFVKGDKPSIVPPENHEPWMPVDENRINAERKRLRSSLFARVLQQYPYADVLYKRNVHQKHASTYLVVYIDEEGKKRETFFHESDGTICTSDRICDDSGYKPVLKEENFRSGIGRLFGLLKPKSKLSHVKTK